MTQNNRKRLLALIEIFTHHTDEDHHLTMPVILEKLLNDYDIKESNRKTIYEDIKALVEFDYPVIFDKGYYMVESPFTLSEIKILIDGINSLKNLDNRKLETFKNKLYGFLSHYEKAFLEAYSHPENHNDKNLIYKLETILYAIKKQTSIIITRNGEEKEIIPLDLHRENDYYYLYYEYPNYKKLYHYRLDHLEQIKDTKIRKEPINSRERLLKKIAASTNAFHSKDEKTVTLEVISDEKRNLERLKDDFANVIINKKTASIVVSVNDVFFGKIASYKNQVIITKPKEVLEEYKQFLQSILDQYKAED